MDDHKRLERHENGESYDVGIAGRGMPKQKLSKILVGDTWGKAVGLENVYAEDSSYGFQPDSTRVVFRTDGISER